MDSTTNSETSTENSVILNVCILPTTSVGESCVSLAQSLPPEPMRFRIDGKATFPHMTVYMARFPEEKIPEVLQAAQALLASATAPVCKHNGYFITGGGYIEASYEKSTELLSLQDSLISALAPFRLNPGAPNVESYFAPYTEEQKKNAEATGYDLAGALYRPHITLGRYKEGEVPTVLPDFPATDLSFTPSTIALYKADDNGAVFEQLGTFTV